MVGWLQKISSEHESRAEGENDEMTVPSRLNDFLQAFRSQKISSTAPKVASLTKLFQCKSTHRRIQNPVKHVTWRSLRK